MRYKEITPTFLLSAFSEHWPNKGKAATPLKYKTSISKFKNTKSNGKNNTKNTLPELECRRHKYKKHP
ncbi:hypothetical protein CWS02_04945 [Enterobacter sp. EA-1]|nr:hypothetical protein CWS02_04945 [Enterobacter sp. EA-1]